MIVQVLGTSCPNCQAFYQRVVNVMSKIIPGTTPEYINDFSKIIEIGAMSSPVLVKDGQLLLVGGYHSDNEIEIALLQGDSPVIKSSDTQPTNCSICSSL